MKSSTLLAAVVAGAAVAAAAHAQAPAEAPPPPYGAPITLEQAKLVVQAAEAEARRRGVAVTISVAEPNGTIALMERMTGASYSSAETSPAKARSAARWLRPTSFWIERMSKGDPTTSTLPDVIGSNGGELIVVGGRTIGAIGVGGSGPNEGDIAKLAVQALK